LKPLSQSAKPHTKSPKPKAISQPLTFFKTLHTILPLKHKIYQEVTIRNTFPIKMTHSPGHTHLTCANTNVYGFVLC